MPPDAQAIRAFGAQFLSLCMYAMKWSSHAPQAIIDKGEPKPVFKLIQYEYDI